MGRADALALGVTGENGRRDEETLGCRRSGWCACAAVPASAQVYYDEPGWAGVQVGPFGFGVGPRYGWRDHGYYAYGGDCPTVRERIVTASVG
jgi:hypothetical protein